MKLSAAQLLRSKGLRVTAARERILEILEAEKEPLSAKVLSARLGPSVDRVTVYRCLQALAEADLVQPEFGGRVTRYCVASAAHHHIECEACHKRECVPCSHTFSKVKGFTKIRHQLVLTGLCLDCAPGAK
jgi:Fur family ferric uptake transcriptional regulator